MRDYGKIHTAFWASADIRDLSDGGKLLAAYLLTGPHSTLIGCFRLPDGYVAGDLGWPPATVGKRFGELFHKGFATRDEGSGWVLVHRFLAWNKIENPNQGKAAAKLFAQVPDANPLKPCLARALRELAPHFPATELEKFESLSKPFRKPFRNQEQEQEQEAQEAVQDGARASGLGADLRVVHGGER